MCAEYTSRWSGWDEDDSKWEEEILKKKRKWLMEVKERFEQQERQKQQVLEEAEQWARERKHEEAR